MQKDSLKLSIIIPAYNEEVHLGETLETLLTSLEQSSIPAYEIIVSNDASMDRTEEIAKSYGVQVVSSGKRNIGATRNVGAAHAKGEYVLFLDADTLVTADTLIALWGVFQSGCVGGGARIQWSEPVSWKGRLPLWIWNCGARLFSLPAGSFLFAKREVFEAIGGFNEDLFAAEELDIAHRLKKHGQLKIIQSPVRTSPRKIQQFTKWEILSLYKKVILSPRKVLQDRSQLDLWYTRRK